MIAGFRAFEFNLPEALLASLVVAFDVMESASLLVDNVALLPDEQGVYQLLYGDRIVYIGKTDAEAGLRNRLSRHAWTIQHRVGLDPNLVTFKALRVFVFTAIDLETQLIRHYGSPSKVAWNNSGFGSNDPGRQRDTTKIKPGGFDDQFPIDLDREITLADVQSEMSVFDVLSLLRNRVPYIVRWETDPLNPRKAHPDLDVKINLRTAVTTARALFENIVAVLTPGWQATRLPGRVILYRENHDYSAGAVIARS